MIKMKQMVAGLFLKFNEVDYSDLGVLMYELSKCHEVDMEDMDIGDLSDYLEANNTYQSCDNIVLSLNNKLSFDTLINKYGISLKRKFEVVQGRIVKDYLDNISTEEFVLRKIRYLEIGKINKKYPTDFLHNEQIIAMQELISQGYLTTSWDDYINDDNYRMIELTQKAKLLLFVLDNEKEIKRFKKDLICLNYDYTLINNYLMSQDLYEDIDKILNAEKFYNYCLGFNLYPYMPKYKERRLYSN